MGNRGHNTGFGKLDKYLGTHQIVEEDGVGGRCLPIGVPEGQEGSVRLANPLAAQLPW